MYFADARCVFVGTDERWSAKTFDDLLWGILFGMSPALVLSISAKHPLLVQIEKYLKYLFLCCVDRNVSKVSIPRLCRSKSLWSNYSSLRENEKYLAVAILELCWSQLSNCIYSSIVQIEKYLRFLAVSIPQFCRSESIWCMYFSAWRSRNILSIWQYLFLSFADRKVSKVSGCIYNSVLPI